jgi:hypothetical protein
LPANHLGPGGTACEDKRGGDVLVELMRVQIGARNRPPQSLLASTWWPHERQQDAERGRETAVGGRQLEPSRPFKHGFESPTATVPFPLTGSALFRQVA